MGTGQLQLQLDWSAGRIIQAEVHLQRPTLQVSQWLAAGTVAQALQHIPLLFSLCGTAQRLAAVQAVERARGLEVSPEVDRARQQLLRLERVREGVWRLLKDWELPLAMAHLKALVAGCQHAQRCGEALWLPGGEGATDILSELNDVLMPLEGVAMALDQVGLDWLEARLRPWAKIRLNTVTDHLPLCPRPMPEQRLTTAGRVTGSAAQALTVVGAAEQIQQRLLGLQQQVKEDLQSLLHPPLTVVSMPSWAVGVGRGQAWVLTARGWLWQDVQLEGEQVQHWQILAPTDWNFQPQGPLPELLKGVVVAQNQVEGLAQDLLLSLNPCVGHVIQVRYA